MENEDMKETLFDLINELGMQLLDKQLSDIEKSYIQGKKDGLRLAIISIDNKPETQALNAAINSSPVGYIIRDSKRSKELDNPPTKDADCEFCGNEFFHNDSCPKWRS